jgi:integrase
MRHRFFLLLRHTYVGAFIASGCWVKVVQSHLGHTSAAITLDVYSHPWPDDNGGARSAVQTFFEGAAPSVFHDEVAG